jgi:AraC-like DNA-binding protein
MSAFSTADLPESRQVELWERHNATALIGLDVRTAGPLRATEFNVRLPQVDLARVAGSGHVVARTADRIGRDPADAVAVYLTLRGDAWFSHRGSTYSLRPGAILICETDQPFERGFTRGLEELVVKVPHTAFEERTGARSPRTPVIAAFARRGSGGARVSGRGDQYAAALARQVGRATRAERPVPADEHTVLDLVAVLAAGQHAAGPAAHRAAACSFIEEHLTDQGLGADQVAAATGISARQLSRVFAADGTSVPRHILSRRLQLGYAMLASPGSAGQAGISTVADVAARCGFGSASYFSHVFRERFGQRASEVLRERRR